ncbi:MAG TPA: hypothetical protein VJ836_01365 [Candidatus Saccharimonadales bacterium]|nr:hypothetical protein [Candidatus Saccharimonadales bacterium]
MAERKPSPEGGPESLEIEPITAADCGWMEALGCRWPIADKEAWLTARNRDIEVGSKRLEAWEVSREQERTAVINARKAFFHVLPVVSNALAQAQHTSLWPPDAIIVAQRTLYARGIDIAALLKSRPELVTYSAKEHLERLDNFEAFGLDSARVVNGFAGAQTYGSKAVQIKMYAMYAAARTFGWDDYKTIANDTVEEQPELLAQPPGMIRILAQIAARTMLPHEPSDVPLATIRALLGLRVEKAVAAYLERRSVIRSPDGLISQAHDRYKNWPIQALQGLILHSIGDPVVKTYLRNYPINDPEACINAYTKQREAEQEAALHAIDLRWEGPLFLGDPDSPTFRAFEKVAASPPLTKEEKQQLYNDIAQGGTAAEHARKVLIVRHLHLAIEAAVRRGRSVETRAGRLGKANLALVFAAHRYDPTKNGDFEGYAKREIADAFNSSPGSGRHDSVNRIGTETFEEPPKNAI